MPPTEILVFTNVLALGVLDAARESGLRVREDGSILGYLGTTEAIGLTTLRPPLTGQGAESRSKGAEPRL